MMPPAWCEVAKPDPHRIIWGAPVLLQTYSRPLTTKILDMPIIRVERDRPDEARSEYLTKPTENYTIMRTSIAELDGIWQ